MSTPPSPIRHARRDALYAALTARSPRRLDAREYARWRHFGWRHSDLDHAVDDLVAAGLAVLKTDGVGIYLRLVRRTDGEAGAP